MSSGIPAIAVAVGTEVAVGTDVAVGDSSGVGVSTVGVAGTADGASSAAAEGLAVPQAISPIKTSRLRIRTDGGKFDLLGMEIRAGL